jgi:branched-chain amino acid aminotransferase
MESSPKYVSINNELIPEAQATLGIGDLSIQRGYGIFDFFKIIDNRPIFIDAHLNRFYNSAKEMHLDVGMDRQALKQAVSNLLEKNNLPNSAIKIILTGGYSDDGYAMVGKPNLIITQVHFVMENHDDLTGLKLVTYNHQRQLPTVKTIDYLQAIRLRPFVISSNADDVLYHNNGFITECPRANFFIVTENEIITPKDHVLRGITRSKLLGLEVENYKIIERAIALEELALAKEAFVTSSTKNTWPVIAIDGKQIGDGKPGKVAGLINEKINELIMEEIHCQA